MVRVLVDGPERREEAERQAGKEGEKLEEKMIGCRQISSFSKDMLKLFRLNMNIMNMVIMQFVRRCKRYFSFCLTSASALLHCALGEKSERRDRRGRSLSSQTACRSCGAVVRRQEQHRESRNSLS
jgi:hypothetical protein